MKVKRLQIYFFRGIDDLALEFNPRELGGKVFVTPNLGKASTAIGTLAKPSRRVDFPPNFCGLGENPVQLIFRLDLS